MIKLNSNEIEIKQFPNGESLIDIQQDMILSYDTINQIELIYESDKDLMALVYITDFIHENGKEVELLVKCFPYSRMDRKEENRLFTLKSVARIINSLNYKKVTIWEPHSDVVTALIDRVNVVNKSYTLTMELLNTLNNVGFSNADLYANSLKKGIYLVFPDNGASKRYGKQFKYPKCIEVNKERDFNTGNIEKIELITPLKQDECDIAIIVDDLCDRGGTFMGTAEKLKEKGVKEIYLVVTHCMDNIFNGSILSSDLIKEVITTDSTLTKRHKKIRVID